MRNYLRIAARVAAPGPDEEVPIESDEVDELIIMLKRQLDLIAQAAQRDKPRRAMKLLEGAYRALQTLLELLIAGHEEVAERKDLVEDKLDQVNKSLRPIRTQIH